MEKPYKCPYCNFYNLIWEEVQNHPCFAGSSVLFVDENTNVVHRNEPTEKFGTQTVVEVEQQEDTGKTDWQDAAVLLLIEEYRKHQSELQKKNTMKKQIWQRIATNMNTHSCYSYSWDQIQNKWKCLLRTYKSIKDHNNATGSHRKNWAFFDAMHELMHTNPAIDPPLLMHNGDTLDSPSSSSRCSTPETSTRKRKRKAVTDISELFQVALQQSQAQHEEEMREKRRFNDLLEKLVHNITSNKNN